MTALSRLKSKHGKTYVIAEVGVNHNGDMGRAKELIDVAVEAGADAAKFQSFRVEDLVRRDSERMAYQVSERTGEVTQFEMLKRVELSPDDHHLLADYCAGKGIDFISTPYEHKSLAFLVDMGVETLKIASTDTTNLLLLEAAAQSGKHVILSSGVTDFWELAKSVAVFRDADALDRLSLMHCLSFYPAPLEQLNLGAIRTMEAAFQVPVGYSDHTLSEQVGAWAVMAGAQLNEKHFTFDKGAVGPDHAASMLPDEYIRYVAAIREAEAALGDGNKRVAEAERPVKRQMQKSLIFAKDLPPGHVLTRNDIDAMRPATGISPLNPDLVLGRRLRVAVSAQTPIDWAHFDDKDGD